MKKSNLIRIKPPFDIRVDFWKANYQLTHVDPFSKMYKRKDSSYIMWCIWLYLDESRYNQLRNDDNKLKSIKNYYKKFNPEEKLTQACIEKYKAMLIPTEQRQFLAEKDSILLRQKMIDRMRKYLDTISDEELGESKTLKMIDTLEKLYKNTDDIYSKYSDVYNMLMETNTNEGSLFGGGNLTIMEKGGLKLIDDEEE